MNGRKPPSKTQPEISALHADLIRFIGESWSRVSKDLQAAQEDAAKGNTERPKVVVWECKPGAELPKDFVPFDLEGWWGTRLYQNLTQTA
jgi:hypothetical protein